MRISSLVRFSTVQMQSSRSSFVADSSSTQKDRSFFPTDRAISLNIGPQWLGIKYAWPMWTWVARRAEVMVSNKIPWTCTTTSAWASVYRIVARSKLTPSCSIIILCPHVLSWRATISHADTVDVFSVISFYVLWMVWETIWWSSLVPHRDFTNFCQQFV